MTLAFDVHSRIEAVFTSLLKRNFKESSANNDKHTAMRSMHYFYNKNISPLSIYTQIPWKGRLIC